MDPLTLMLILGAVGYLMAKDGQETAAKDGREITLAQGLTENAAKVAKPVVAKARASAKRTEPTSVQAARAAGFTPFGKPADKMPPFSAKNPSGFEQFLVAQPSLLKRLLKMFGHEPTAKVYRGPASGPAGESSGPDGATGPDTQVNARGLTPEQEWTTRDRIAERLTNEAPEAGVAPAAWLQRIKDEEYARARAEFAPDPSPRKPRVVPGVVEPATTQPEPEHAPANDAGGEQPMLEATARLPFKRAEGLARMRHAEEMSRLEQQMAAQGASSVEIGNAVREASERFSAYWAEQRRMLEQYLLSPEARDRCPECGDLLAHPNMACPYTCNACGCAKAAAAGSQQPSSAAASTIDQAPHEPSPAQPAASPAAEGSVSAGSPAPLRYMEAVHAFAASVMTTSSIPALIGSLRQCGEAFTQQGQVLHQVATRMDEEALLDPRVVELVRTSAEAALRAGAQFTQSAQIAQAYYQRWVEAVANGARVPSQAVLTATASS